MLAELSSRDIAEWKAFAMLEQVGNPVPVDPEEEAEKERQKQVAEKKVRRARIEGSLRVLKERQDGRSG